jgi:Nitrous oxide reductase
MFIGICPKCGGYSTDKSIDIQNGINYSVCKDCGNPHPFKRLPLFVVIGSSGSGKTNVCLEMPNVTQDIICLDGDIFLPMAAATDGNWDSFRYLVMEVCVNISQYGKPVAIFHGGMPDDYINNDMAKFFQKIVPIGIYADEEDIVKRLSNRPAWRKSSSPDMIENMVKYNAEVSKIPVSVNTTGKKPIESADELFQIMKREL